MVYSSLKKYYGDGYNYSKESFVKTEKPLPVKNVVSEVPKQPVKLVQPIRPIIKENIEIKPEPELKPVPQVKNEKEINGKLEIYEKPIDTNLGDPNVWGPSFWFILHNGAYHYPKKASPIAKENTKGFIIGIPNMLPCKSCSIHARKFINERKNILDDIVSSRENLFKFYVDFHNAVNLRTGKKIYTLEEAYDMYSNKEIVRYSFESS